MRQPAPPAIMSEPPPPDALETRTAWIWLGGDGIVRELDRPGSAQTLVDAQENVAANAQAALGRRRPLLVDMSAIESISREARVYYAGAEAATVLSAVALLVRSPLSRAIGNFFLGLNRPAVPTRLFSAEAEALAWLRGFVP